MDLKQMMDSVAREQKFFDDNKPSLVSPDGKIVIPYEQYTQPRWKIQLNLSGINPELASSVKDYLSSKEKPTEQGGE